MRAPVFSSFFERIASASCRANNALSYLGITDDAGLIAIDLKRARRVRGVGRRTLKELSELQAEAKRDREARR